MGFDWNDGAKVQMDEVVKLLEGKGNVALIYGVLGRDPQTKFEETAKEIIAQNPDMSMVLEGSANWDRGEALTLVENWLNSGKEIDAIVANADEMAIGASMALQAAGKKDLVLVAGINASPAALELVLAGNLEVTVFTDFAQLGQIAMETAIKLAKGETVEKQILLDWVLVDEENAADIAIKWK